MSKQVSEKPKVAAEKPPDMAKKDSVEKIPDKNTGTKSTEKNPMNDSKNPELKKKENQPPIENENFEIRKSPRIKKRPADDTGKRSSRKSQPKKRKECSTPISGLYIR